MPTRTVIAEIKQRNGSLRVTLEGPIFIAEFKGACTPKIAQVFHQAVLDAIPQLPENGWCYLSSSEDYAAALPEVEESYAQTYRLCMENGCIVEAYCMPSVVGLAQVDKARKACGVESPIQSLSFKTISDAKYFLLSTLEHIQARRKEKTE
ncbi:hypothetical protein [Alteromonas flava]|uniref:hypothetical protein n=1 Tax=Alteromonas flava TaxID=2048003 RepID=UPI000C28ECDD|nr:hypothetical protein [Alteromonas flava]